MTIPEFKEKRKELIEEHRRKDYALQLQYVESINPFKKGDILESMGTKILVDNIQIQPSTHDIPTLRYYGVKLKKDNSPFISGERDTIWLSNYPVKIEP